MQCAPISEIALLFGKVPTICTFVFLLGATYRPLEEGTDRLSRNFCKKLPFCAA